MATTKQISHLRKGFKDLSVISKRQTISFAPSINYCYRLKGELEKYLEFISISISSVNGLNIFGTTLAMTKLPKMGSTLGVGIVII